jgi:DNA gyrase inhibitor GyrI
VPLLLEEKGRDCAIHAAGHGYENLRHTIQAVYRRLAPVSSRRLRPRRDLPAYACFTAAA